MTKKIQVGNYKKYNFEAIQHNLPIHSDLLGWEL
jgi:hypothetical protein